MSFLNFELGSSENRNRNIVILTAITVVLLAGGAVIAGMTSWLFPEPTSTEARLIDGLFWLMMFIGGAIFLLVQGALLYSVIAFRKPADDDTDGPNVHGNFTLEFVWTAIPTIIVFILSVYSYVVWVNIQAPQENELSVNVVAQRYAFAFEYPDEATGEAINDNVLRTYVGRPVKLSMEATDVIHSFWVPTMRMKQDMLPGRTTEVRFTPTEAGIFPVVCTELCGGGHGGMRAEIWVYPDEESYMGWFDQQLDCILNPPEDPATRGRGILASGKYPCAGCHVLDDLAEAGWVGQIGPNMNGIGDRAAERVPGESAEEYLHTSLVNPAAYLAPGYQNLMPMFAEDQMPVEERNAIVAYLLTQGSEPVEFEAACPGGERETFQQLVRDFEAGTRTAAR